MSEKNVSILYGLSASLRSAVWTGDSLRYLGRFAMSFPRRVQNDCRGARDRGGIEEPTNIELADNAQLIICRTRQKMRYGAWARMRIRWSLSTVERVPLIYEK